MKRTLDLVPSVGHDSKAAASDLHGPCLTFLCASAVKEMILFVSRLVGGRTPEGNKSTLQHEEYLVHAYNKQVISSHSL
jgi:hypothetical protein